jgi:hypothetical protein
MYTKLFSNSKILFILFFSLLSTFTSFAQKTDIVTLLNGDKITGEIKSLQTGLLNFKTDNMGTINIEWNKIKSVQTNNVYEVELVDGRVYYGSIEPGKLDGTLLIKGVTPESRLFMNFIVKITRIKESFWDILSGFVKLGFSFTKASQIGQLSFGFSSKYRTKDFYAELNANSVITTTNQEATSRKQDIFLTYNRFLENRWFWAGRTGAEENTELGIKLRTSFGGGAGFNIIQTNKNFLNTLAGLSLNREWFIDSVEARNNLEGLISSNYQIFIYDHPKVSLETALNIFPGLTDFGRVRSNFDANLDWEIFLDFYWVVSFYFNYDNKPTGNASQSDYRIESSIKYEL